LQTWGVSARPFMHLDLVRALFLCLVGVLGVEFAGSAHAEEGSLETFDTLYEDSLEQGSGGSGAGVIADPDIDTQAWDAVLDKRKRNLPLLNSKTHHPDDYADLSKREGDWELAPVIVGRRQDGEASQSDVMAPLGVELNREF